MSSLPAASGVVTIAAQPAPFDAAVRSTAVIVVDMQNDFASVGGMFERADIDIDVIRAAIEPTRALIGAARTCDLRIVYLKMGFQPDLSDTGGADSPNWQIHRRLNAGDTVVAPDGSPSRVLIRDTWNTAIIDELTPEPDDIVVWKHRYSGFFETDLDTLLRSAGIDTLIFVGATTSICVDSTVRDAMFRDYRCLVVEDCTAEPIGEGLARSNHDATLLTTQILFGSTATSDAVIAALAPR